MAADVKPNELHLTRVYDAPVEIVWNAWTDPEQVAKWWGPRGFTLTTHRKNFRVGGIWHYTMHGPDGTDYPNKTVYHEIEPQRKLVYDHGGYDDRPPLFRVTVLFSESDGKTTMDMTMTMPSVEEAEAVRKLIKQAGGNATWDRLAEYLDKERQGKELFVINRTFEAPLQVMFDMWTDPQRLAQWLPPAGFDMQFLRADIRRGGVAVYEMTNHSDITVFGRFEFVEFEPPTGFTYRQQFCDAEEVVSKHPLAPVWPETLLNTIELTAETDNRTRVTITSEAISDVTAEEIAAFVAERPGMTLGWNGSFDKLDAAPLTGE